MSAQTPNPDKKWTPGRLGLTFLHWIIILNFLFEIGYAGYMIFFVIVPEGGGSGPLMGRATAMPFEQMVTRRLYASECWIAISGLAIYLAITEIGPRMWRLPPRS